MTDEEGRNYLENPSLYEGTYLEFLGFRLTAWKQGFSRIEMPVRDEHRNTVDYLHGGVIASLLDIAGAFSGSYGITGENVLITVNLNCSFMAPVEGDTVIAEGELVRTTNSMIFAQSKLLDPGNKRLCATATATYKRRKRGAAQGDPA